MNEFKNLIKKANKTRKMKICIKRNDFYEIYTNGKDLAVYYKKEDLEKFEEMADIFKNYKTVYYYTYSEARIRKKDYLYLSKNIIAKNLCKEIKNEKYFREVKEYFGKRGLQI